MTGQDPIPLDVPGHPRLHAERWPGNSPRGVLVIAPGLGDHCGRYDHVARRLAGEPGLVDVVGLDYRGHGRSEGRRGVVGDYRELLDDLVRVVERVRRSGLPLFLLGHSNGGLVALLATLEGRIAPAGLVLSNPALSLKVQAPGWKLALGRTLRAVAPWVTLGGRLPGSHLTRDPAMIAARKADPHVHNRLSPPIFFGMIEAGQRVLESAGELRVPTLLIVGQDDPVIDPQETIDFYSRLGSPDRTLRLIAEGVHEPLHDLERECTIGFLASWLRPRVGQLGPTPVEGVTSRPSTA